MSFNRENQPEQIPEIEVPNKDEADHVAGSIQDQIDHWEGERQLQQAEEEEGKDS